MEKMILPTGLWGRFFDSDAPSPDSLTMERIRIKSFNESAGTMTDWNCPECRNKGDVAFLDGDKMRCRPCKCQPIRRCIRRMRESGLGDALEHCTFDRYEAIQPWQKSMKQVAYQYAQHPNGWLLMAGQSGCGKTHLCTAVVGELLRQGMEVVYMPWKEDTAKLKAAAMDAEGRDRLMDRLMNAQVLYIDDLLWYNRADSHSRPSDADVKLAFELLTHRENGKKLTIISTELMPHELGRINEAVAGRILHNAVGNICTVNADQRRNYRLRHVVTV